MITTPPPFVPASSAWSPLHVVRVLWDGRYFEMLGRVDGSGIRWWLWYYPKGYGGPTFTDRGREGDRPEVRSWRRVSIATLSTLFQPQAPAPARGSGGGPEQPSPGPITTKT
jgi:hypothetical protein